jgi:hypothetical protein
MGADMSQCCQCEPRRAVSIQLDNDEATESKVRLITREPASDFSRGGQAGQAGQAGPESHQASMPRLAKAREAPEEMTVQMILDRLVALKKHQANLKAGKEANWREKWQQADDVRQDLFKKLMEANRKHKDKPNHQPVKFDRSASMVSIASVDELRSTAPADLRHILRRAMERARAGTKPSCRAAREH